MGTLCTSADLPVAQPRGSPVSDLGWSWPFRLDCEEIFTSLQWLSSVKKVLGQTLDLSFSLSLFLLSGSPWHGLWGGANHRDIPFHVPLPLHSHLFMHIDIELVFGESSRWNSAKKNYSELFWMVERHLEMPLSLDVRQHAAPTWNWIGVLPFAVWTEYIASNLVPILEGQPWK